MMTFAKTILLFSGVLICTSSIAQQKQNTKKRAEQKATDAKKLSEKEHFNVAGFSEKRTLVQEKHRIPGTDSVVTETYYVWLLPR